MMYVGIKISRGLQAVQDNRRRYVRSTPESGHVRRNWSLWANTGIDARSGSLGCDAVAYLYAWRDLDQSIILRSLYSSMRSPLPLNLAIASFSRSEERRVGKEYRSG